MGSPDQPWTGLDYQPTLPWGSLDGPWLWADCSTWAQIQGGWRDGGLTTIQKRQIHYSVPFVQRSQGPLAARAAQHRDSQLQHHALGLLPRFITTKSHPHPTVVRTGNCEGCHGFPVAPKLPARGTPAPNIPSKVQARLYGGESKKQRALSGHGDPGVTEGALNAYSP